MRTTIPLLLAALLACAPSDPASPTVAASTLPPPGLVLDATLLHPGAPATFTFDGVPANRKVYLVVSPTGAGNGPCYPQLRGSCLGLRAPIQALGSVTADGAGHASLSAVIPPSLAGRTVTFQAIAPTTTPATLSNTLQRTIADDVDGDGVDWDLGDCDDGDPSVGPQSFDVPGNGVDDDCDGAIDNVYDGCDGGLALDATAPFDAAAALGLCGASSTGHGLVDAQWVLPSGAPAPGSAAFDGGHGLMPTFGAMLRREGDSLLALSSGTARAPGQPGYQAPAPGSSKGYAHSPPPGFPLTRTDCPSALSGTASDGIGLQVQVRVPANATGLSFRHRALFTDWPANVCTSFNDGYGVMMTPAPAVLGGGTQDVVRNAGGGPLTVADPTLLTTCTGCPDGSAALDGTGFEGHGATGWLRTDVPATPGSLVTLRFVVWDAGDALLDTTGLFDGFRWLDGAVTLQTVPDDSLISPDDDGDGLTVLEGDCDDADADVGPHALDTPGNGVDDDCDGAVDNAPAPCDAGLAVTDARATAAAAAMGLCPATVPGGQGLVAARYLLPDGAPAPATAAFDLGHGLSPGFGAIEAQEGVTLLALSSGTARTPAQPGFTSPINGLDKGYAHTVPPTFPLTRNDCAGPLSSNANDGAALEVTLHVPSNAHGFAFSHRALFADYPALVCTSFNDAYTVLMDPAPPGLGAGAQPIVDDGLGGPITVTTSSFLTSCAGCADGLDDLVGTGFDANGATAWLRTEVPATPGDTVTLRFAVWDSGDGAFDSTVLFDAFTWLQTPVTLGTTVQTGPISPDDDGDGVPVNRGDCDDTDPLVGPQSFDIPGNGVDDDCNGAVDDDASVCDGGHATSDTSALNAAATVGLCTQAPFDPAQGVLSARYTLPDGSTAPVSSSFDLGHGLLATFGPNDPEAGAALLALSSGTARGPLQSGYQPPELGFTKGYAHATPTGFPLARTDCGVDLSTNGHDGIGLEVTVRVPANATGFAVHHRAYFADYPNFVCSAFNDAYGLMVDPAPAPVGPRAHDVVLDAGGGPITQTSPFVTTCSGCADGGVDLVGTGFEGHAATGWLRTEVPVTPGDTVTLRFVVWDSGDGTLDTTALFDAFTWLTGPVTLETTAL